uniref:Retrovirus-related Pol polyprotein from transposon TNT 1-94 n=1 Tax=Tanacetum cinerariifolium TaxID=118510 RepID=A0A6L2KL27_TANCI|nr:retrovirus-related Pol polyprotein from transposon TNT 1-94 [Tanacetum cinerariifolium]
MTVKYPKGIAKNVLVRIGKFIFPVDFVIIDMPKDIKVPLILERPFLSTTRAKIDVYKRKITLRVGEEKVVVTSIEPASSLIKRVCMLSLRERTELDLEARLMGETLKLNRSLDPFFEDYIELNDLNEPIELRRNQGDNLMPTIKEGEVFKTRDNELDTRINDYPSYCDYDKKIHIDCAHNLKFSCMIGFEFTHANFFPLLYVNVMSKKFHNSIMKGKMKYKGNNVVGALMNIPIFVETFSVVTNFVVLENMDAYHDEGMGDVIVGKPFLREVRIKAKRFGGTITLYKDDRSVTKWCDHIQADDIKVSIPGVERPWLSEAEGFILPNHDTDESSVYSTPLPSLKKLDGVELISGSKTIKSILKSKSTFKAEAFKGVIINEPSSAPARDHLAKFNENADDGYFLGYSLVSKAFKVFNTKRQKTKETYHITFDKSLDAIKFTKPSVDNINIAESNPPDEYLHPYKPSQRKGTSGACQLLGGKLVCWSAKKQQSVAMSSAEAEYVPAAGCCGNILWIKKSTH